jgi:hypothetical protein
MDAVSRGLKKARMKTVPAHLHATTPVVALELPDWWQVARVVSRRGWTTEEKSAPGRCRLLDS